MRFYWGLTITLLFLVVLLLPAGPAGGSEESVRIAGIFGFSGMAARENRFAEIGVRLAVEKVNASGGVLGLPAAVDFFDNQSSPIGSKVAADRAVSSPATVIVGPDWSSQALAVAKVAQKAGMPMIATAATHPDVTLTGDCVFRVCFNDRFQGAVMARFAREDLHAEKAVIVVDVTSHYSLFLADEFRRNFIRFGGEIIGRYTYKSSQNHFRDLIRRLSGQSADVIYIPGHSEAGRIAAEAKTVGVEGIPIGGDGWGTEGFLQEGGSRLKRGYYLTHWSPQVKAGASERFLREYGGRYDVNEYTALAFDAGNLAFEAIRRAGSTNRAEVRTVLAATSNFPGVTGEISFDEQGDPRKSGVIVEVRDGVPEFLKTVPPPAP